jgi:hypothetical protein
MASFEFLAIILTGLGLTVSIVYYANILSNANKTRELQLKAQELALKNQELQLETRQASLFMQLFSIYDTREFLEDFGNIAYHYDYKDLEDWENKYGPLADMSKYSSWGRVGRYFDGVGILLRKELIDPNLVTDLLREIIIVSWEAMSTWVYEVREMMNTPDIWMNFEYLYTVVRERYPDISSQDVIMSKLKDMVEEQTDSPN